MHQWDRDLLPNSSCFVPWRAPGEKKKKEKPTTGVFQLEFIRSSFTNHCVIGFASGTRVCLREIGNARNKLAALTLSLTLLRAPIARYFVPQSVFSSSSSSSLVDRVCARFFVIDVATWIHNGNARKLKLLLVARISMFLCQIS